MKTTNQLQEIMAKIDQNRSKSGSKNINRNAQNFQRHFAKFWQNYDEFGADFRGL